MPDSISQSNITGGAMVAQSAGLQNQQTQVEQSTNPGQDQEQDKMFDFSTARVHLDRIVRDWDVECEDTDVRRKTRDVEVDTEGLRQKGDLDEDETIIPVRVIDVNIQREHPPYVNYIKNSRRICTFRSLSNPDQDPQNIEQEFTRGMTYTSWEKAIFKCRDGAATHGWAAIEVVYDPSKPLNVGLEYIAHDELFWPRTVKNIQDSPRIIRKYDVTITKLREWIRKFGFNPVQVEGLIASRKDTMKENETLTIYKCYFKKEGAVYVEWFALTDGVSDWLKKPEKYFCGISKRDPTTQQWIPDDVQQYSIFLLPYKETEKPKEVDHKGRVFYDEAKQEAQTAVLSGFVNGLTRASSTCASPAQEDGTGSSLKEIEDVKIVGGRIFNRPLNFWSHPYPDPMILKYLQYADDSNSEETNQVNFAALNREDSRKTAKEIGAAQQQQGLLNSVELTLFSTFIREVYSFAWLIVQSEAMQGLIVFLRIQVVDNMAFQQSIKGIQDGYQQQMAILQLSGQQVHPDVLMQAQNVVVQQMQKLQQNPPMKWQNNFDVIGQTWELRAAGDVDVIQRQEKIMQMKQDWPVVSQTPLAMRFLADLIKLEYPDVGEQYAQILGETDMLQQANGLSAALAEVLMGVMKQHPDIFNSLPPEQQAQVKQMIAQAMSQVGKQPGEEGANKGNSEQQKQLPQSNNQTQQNT